LVDYAFTARMEDELDDIAQGEEEAVPWLKRFYFGVDAAPARAKSTRAAPTGGLAVGLRTLVAERLNEIDARAINSLPLGKDDQDRDIIVRVGRYGPYLQRQDDTASIPEDLPPDEVTLEKAIALLDAPSGDRLLGTDPESELPVYVRTGRFGAYVQLGEAGGKEKPRTGSLLKSMTPASMTLEEALKMLSLPRVVGDHPESHVPITAQLGRYGPYISCGKDSRSVEKEEDVFTITLEQAVVVLATPKTRGSRKAAEPIREIGNDEFSGGLITLREGRFGYYVTDGETNASLAKGDMPETIDNARAQELLHIRRERGPGTKKKAKKKASKASAAKKEPKAAKAKGSSDSEEPEDDDAAEEASAEATVRRSNKKLTSRRPPAAKPAKKATKKKAAARARASEQPDAEARPEVSTKKRPAAKAGKSGNRPSKSPE
jgi:DNA topoisomerase-1